MCFVCGLRSFGEFADDPFRERQEVEGLRDDRERGFETSELLNFLPA
jgi:hypothetical protein